MNQPRLSRRAHQDLIELAKYIAKDNPVAAEHLLERLESACQQLTETPSLGFPFEGTTDELRVWPVGNYVILYRIEPDGIGVVRIVHGARDLSRLFPESP